MIAYQHQQYFQMKQLIVFMIHLNLQKQYWNASWTFSKKIDSVLASIQEQLRQEAEEDGNEGEEVWLCGRDWALDCDYLIIFYTANTLEKERPPIGERSLRTIHTMRLNTHSHNPLINESTIFYSLAHARKLLSQNHALWGELKLITDATAISAGD